MRNLSARMSERPPKTQSILINHAILPAALLVLFLFIGASLSSPAQETKPPVLGFWKVNWEKSAPHIQTVPLALQQRFKSAAELREFLAPQLVGMTLEIHPDKKAFIRAAPDFKEAYCTWRLSPTDRHYWIRIESTGANHGFIPVDNNKASLLFEVKVNAQGVIRIPVLAERPPVTPDAPK
jgi:hypothetical protein